MIIRTLFSTFFFVTLLAWAIYVVAEREPCVQVNKAAAPVRLVMEGIRAVDRNLQVVAERETWLLWSLRVDAMTQRGIARFFHGPDLSCSRF